MVIDKQKKGQPEFNVLLFCFYFFFCVLVSVQMKGRLAMVYSNGHGRSIELLVDNGEKSQNREPRLKDFWLSRFYHPSNYIALNQLRMGFLFLRGSQRVLHNRSKYMEHEARNNRKTQTKAS